MSVNAHANKGISIKLVSERSIHCLTFHCECGTATLSSSIILDFTSVDSIVLKAGLENFKDCHRVIESHSQVATITEYGIIFVPAYSQRSCASNFAFKLEWLSHLYDFCSWQFLYKLWRFCKTKITTCYHNE